MPLTAAEIDKYDTPGMASVQFWLKHIAYHLAKLAEKQEYFKDFDGHYYYSKMKWEKEQREEDGGIQVHE